MWSQILDQQPWFPWYQCAYCLLQPFWLPLRPWRSHLTSELNSVTSTTLASMCILPLTAILVASEAMAASKRPRRSHLTSELKSVTSITYVTMLLRPLNVNIHLILTGGEGQTWPTDFVSSTEVKTTSTNRFHGLSFLLYRKIAIQLHFSSTKWLNLKYLNTQTSPSPLKTDPLESVPHMDETCLCKFRLTGGLPTASKCALTPFATCSTSSSACSL